MPVDSDESEADPDRMREPESQEDVEAIERSSARSSADSAANRAEVLVAMSISRCNAIYSVLNRFTSDETEEEEEQLVARIDAITDYMQGRGFAEEHCIFACHVEYATFEICLAP